jgi:predicted small secreted protein
MTKKSALLLICLGFILAGCNTVRGVGQDVQKAGSAIENSVKK